MRKIAAKHGADAIYIESATKEAAGELASVVSAAKAEASAMFNTGLGQSSGNK
jgi:hypothetical protein